MRCLETARLLSEVRDHPLSRWKHFSLRVHLLICAVCRTYEKQLAAVCGISHHAGIEPSTHAPHLPPDRKQAIQNALSRDR